MIRGDRGRDVYIAVDFSQELWGRLSLPPLQFRITAVTKGTKGVHVEAGRLFLVYEPGCHDRCTV